MTRNYLIFMGAMTGALAVWVIAWARTILLFRRHARPGESMLNPQQGIMLWKRLFTADAFGANAEPARRGVTRTYLLALALFALAIVLFYWLPAVPRA